MTGNSERRNDNPTPSLTAKSNAANNNDVILWADPATHALLISGTISAGSLTNNNAAPGANNQGVLPAIANAAAPTYTEGFQVLLSTDLSGALRVTGSLSVGGTTDGATFTAGSSTGTPAMGAYHSVIDTVADGKQAIVAITNKRAQYVSLFDASGNALLGQKAMAASIPVVLASDQASVPVSAAQGTAAALTAGWPVIMGELGDTTGTFTNGTQTTSVTTPNIDGYPTVLVSINGTYGTATAVFELSDDGGTTWYPVSGARMDTGIIEGGYTSLTNTNRTWVITAAGADSVRVRSTAVASGTVNVRMSVTSAPTNMVGSVQLGSAIPAGANVIGAVTQSGTWNVGTVTAVTAVTTVSTVTNLAQMNGAALLMGNGVTGTGSQRVTLASDNSAVALWGHGATAASVPANAVLGGGRGSTANPTAVTDGQMVAALRDKLGKAVVVGAIRDLKVNQVTTITASTSETTILTAVASTFLDLYGLIISNTSATAVNVAIKDSTAGTTQLNVSVPAGETRGFMLPAGDGIKQGTVNNNWTATSSGSVSSLVITALAVKNI